MKALVGAFNQEKALVGAFSVIVQPVVEPMDRFTALSRMERISETSEGAASRSSSEDDPRRGGRAEVRRSSSGITSSSFIHKLSPDYQSVYSKEEDEKRRSRDKDIYKSSSRV